jgi:hypothetical protein
VETYTEVYVEGAEGIRTFPLRIQGVGVRTKEPANEKSPPP